jgi:two-component system chemotaxis response regulator CheY
MQTLAPPRPLSVLVVDDEAVSRLVLRAAVEDLGHHVEEAASGDAAWARISAGLEADVVITDHLMPGIGGFELCRRIRAIQTDVYTYVVVVTALDDPDDVLAGMEAGADDYLTKPLDIRQLALRLVAAQRVTEAYRELAGHRAELERANGELVEMARTDALTRLGNRRRLYEDLEALHARATRYGHNYCIGLVDLDCFKAYNDTYGHSAGDEALKAVADALTSQCRGGDAVYRYGGEELVVLLSEQTLDSACVAVERMRNAVAALAIPHRNNAAADVVTISAGVATVSPGDQVTTVLTAADDALYRAKAAGRNRVTS